jgi:biotin transporter BioY
LLLALPTKIRKFRRKSLVGQIVVTLLGLELLFMSSFISLPLPTATRSNLINYLHNREIVVLSHLPDSWREELIDKYPNLAEPKKDVGYSLYSPQCPVAVFAGYMLGPLLGLIAASMYFVLGMVGPFFGLYLFASGGGPFYYGQPGCGYLLGMVAASWVAGRVTAPDRTSVRQLLAIVAGLAAVHVTGLTYLTVLSALRGALPVAGTEPDWHDWIVEQVRNLSVYPLPYDALFSLLLVGLGFPFRWLANTLTAPDIALKAKPQPRLEDI